MQDLDATRLKYILWCVLSGIVTVVVIFAITTWAMPDKTQATTVAGVAMGMPSYRRHIAPTSHRHR